jgi:hypothetical protein
MINQLHIHDQSTNSACGVLQPPQRKPATQHAGFGIAEHMRRKGKVPKYTSYIIIIGENFVRVNKSRIFVGKCVQKNK